MTDNPPGQISPRPRPPRRWTTPVIIVLSIGLAVLVGGLFVKGMLGPVQTDGAFSLSGALTANTRASFLKSFTPAMRDGCVKSANAALSSKVTAASANDISARIEAYCGCLSDRAPHEFSIFELISLKSPAAGGPVAAKLNKLVRECEAKMPPIGQ